MAIPVKQLVWGGVATAILGPALIAGVVVSVGAGTGQFTGIVLEDGLPALVGGFQEYEGGKTPGLFGGDAPAPLGSAPGGPANPK